MKKMKTINVSAIMLALLPVFFFNCSSNDDDYERGNWVQRSWFNGVPRSNAVGFVIDNAGYMGTGYNADNYYLSDFWKYNIEGDYWEQKADFPGVARTSASGFAVNGKGYLGLGYDGDNNLSDFWEYDPTTNQWMEKANFGGGVRRASTGFAVNNYGYIGTGYDGNNDRKDFWRYDPTSNEWTEVLGFGGNKRRDAMAFVISDKAYFGTGVTSGIYQLDFWEFDPVTETWTQKDRLDDDDDYNILRANATGLSINGMGYIAGGYHAGALSSVWEYDPASDTWEDITGIEGGIRQDPVAFSTGLQGFVLLGNSGTLYLDDVYELFPQEEYDDED